MHQRNTNPRLATRNIPPRTLNHRYESTNDKSVNKFMCSRLTSNNIFLCFRTLMMI